MGARADGIALAAAAADGAGLVARAVAAEGEARAARRRLGDIKVPLHLEAEVNELRAALDEQSAAASKATHQLELARKLLATASTERDRLQRQLRAARAAQNAAAAPPPPPPASDAATSPKKLAETGALGGWRRGARWRPSSSRGRTTSVPPHARARAVARARGGGAAADAAAASAKERVRAKAAEGAVDGARAAAEAAFEGAAAVEAARREVEAERGRRKEAEAALRKATRPLAVQGELLLLRESLATAEKGAAEAEAKQRAATKRAAADRAELVSARARLQRMGQPLHRDARRGARFRRVAAGVAAPARALGEWRRAAAEPKGFWERLF